MNFDLPQSGDVVDQRYRVIEQIGQGGYGAVFKAIQLTTGQPVALKLLRPERIGSETPPGAVSRREDQFQREMHLIARLGHPHIVRLLDSGRLEGGQLYIVLELIEGLSLSRLLWLEGPLSPSEAQRLMAQVVDALCCAHSEHVVHRDLKPSNIMITQTGGQRHAHILDFGIAGITKDGQTPEILQTLTQDLKGTPAYMAPEQWLPGYEALPQTDLYSWGLVFLECLTGRPAIRGKTVQALLLQQISPRTIPLPLALADHPLGQLLSRCMAKPIARRPTSSKEVLAALHLIDTNDLDTSALIAETPHSPDFDVLEAVLQPPPPLSPNSATLAGEDSATVGPTSGEATPSAQGTKSLDSTRETPPPGGLWRWALWVLIAAGLGVLLGRFSFGPSGQNTETQATSEGTPTAVSATGAEGGSSEHTSPVETLTAAPSLLLATVRVESDTALLGISEELQKTLRKQHPDNTFDLAFGASVLAEHTWTRPALDVMPEEVTWDDWNTVSQTSPSMAHILQGVCPEGLPQQGSGGGVLVGLGALEAEMFCVAAGMRLPSALEWEAIARGLEGRSFAIQGEMTPERGVALGLGPAPGLAWSATPEGVRDMTGSVSEWVRCETEDYGYCRDGYGYRGGSWRSGEFWRFSFAMGIFEIGAHAHCMRSEEIGFRCVHNSTPP